MAARPIREVQGLDIVYKHINDNKAENGGLEPVKYFAIESLEDLESATQNHPWILNEVSFIIFLSSFYLTLIFKSSLYLTSIFQTSVSWLIEVRLG